MFSFEPKNERNYFLISALASKNESNQNNEGTLGSILRISFDQAVEFPRMLLVIKIDFFFQCTVDHSALFYENKKVFQYETSYSVIFFLNPIWFSNLWGLTSWSKFCSENKEPLLSMLQKIHCELNKYIRGIAQTCTLHLEDLHKRLSSWKVFNIHCVADYYAHLLFCCKSG